MDNRRKKKSLWKKLHKWPALVVALFIVLWAISGIVLNHRHTFSSFDVNRNLLPAEHRYTNWNNAAIRGSLRIDSSENLFYGNIGVWKHRTESGSFENLNVGFPEGADHFKINCLKQTVEGHIYAGTRFGLYRMNRQKGRWENIAIPHHDQHVVDLLERSDSLWVMTRSHLWTMSLADKPSFAYKKIPAPEGYDNKVGLFKTLWVIHSGEIYGLVGKLLVDLVALIFVFLTLSGLVYFFFPRLMKKRKQGKKPIRKLASMNRWSLKWHNKIGIWLALVLFITTLTGMFLRPPLLIAIAQSRVEKIPYSMLDDGNPWYDQLRRILYDPEKGVVYLASSEGIFLLDDDLAFSPVPAIQQPPASVMGYNVFEHLPGGYILVGSFSGLYLWNPSSGAIYDYMNGTPHIQQPGPAIPISNNMVAGYYKDDNDQEYVFDYNRGVVPIRHKNPFPGMPSLISDSPMPLWNVALELHTARLFKPLIGDFYILFIPLFGLSTLLILISGVLLWIRKYNRQRKHI